MNLGFKKSKPTNNKPHGPINECNQSRSIGVKLCCDFCHLNILSKNVETQPFY